MKASGFLVFMLRKNIPVVYKRLHAIGLASLSDIGTFYHPESMQATAAAARTSAPASVAKKRKVTAAAAAAAWQDEDEEDEDEVKAKKKGSVEAMETDTRTDKPEHMPMQTDAVNSEHAHVDAVEAEAEVVNVLESPVKVNAVANTHAREEVLDGLDLVEIDDDKPDATYAEKYPVRVEVEALMDDNECSAEEKRALKEIHDMLFEIDLSMESHETDQDLMTMASQEDSDKEEDEKDDKEKDKHRQGTLTVPRTISRKDCVRETEPDNLFFRDNIARQHWTLPRCCSVGQQDDGEMHRDIKDETLRVFGKLRYIPDTIHAHDSMTTKIHKYLMGWEIKRMETDVLADIVEFYDDIFVKGVRGPIVPTSTPTKQKPTAADKAKKDKTEDDNFLSDNNFGFGNMQSLIYGVRIAFYSPDLMAPMLREAIVQTETCTPSVTDVVHSMTAHMKQWRIDDKQQMTYEQKCMRLIHQAYNEHLCKVSSPTFSLPVIKEREELFPLLKQMFHGRRAVCDARLEMQPVYYEGVDRSQKDKSLLFVSPLKDEHFQLDQKFYPAKLSDFSDYGDEIHMLFLMRQMLFACITKLTNNNKNTLKAEEADIFDPLLCLFDCGTVTGSEDYFSTDDSSPEGDDDGDDDTENYYRHTINMPAGSYHFLQRLFLNARLYHCTYAGSLFCRALCEIRLRTQEANNVDQTAENEDWEEMTEILCRANLITRMLRMRLSEPRISAKVMALCASITDRCCAGFGTLAELTGAVPKSSRWEGELFQQPPHFAPIAEYLYFKHSPFRKHLSKHLTAEIEPRLHDTNMTFIPPAHHTSCFASVASTIQRIAGMSAARPAQMRRKKETDKKTVFQLWKECRERVVRLLVFPLSSQAVCVLTDILIAYAFLLTGCFASPTLIKGSVEDLASSLSDIKFVLTYTQHLCTTVSGVSFVRSMERLLATSARRPDLLTAMLHVRCQMRKVRKLLSVLDVLKTYKDPYKKVQKVVYMLHVVCLGPAATLMSVTHAAYKQLERFGQVYVEQTGMRGELLRESQLLRDPQILYGMRVQKTDEELNLLFKNDIAYTYVTSTHSIQLCCL